MNTISLRQIHSLKSCSPFLRVIATGLILISTTLLTGCAGGGGEGVPSISSSSSAAGAMANLAWDPVQDPTVSGYYVHYGTQSSGQSGSCSYDNVQFVSSPSATITDLAHNTHYYFAVSAYNGIEGSCSTEVSMVTSI